MTDRAIVVYWRPGCGFCASLLRGLERAGLTFDRANIWDDDAAAAFVRSVAGGNETVPTVRIGSVALVNPSARDVLRTVATELPSQVPDGYEPSEPGLAARLLTRALGR